MLLKMDNCTHLYIHHNSGQQVPSISADISHISPHPLPIYSDSDPSWGYKSGPPIRTYYSGMSL